MFNTALARERAWLVQLTTADGDLQQIHCGAEARVSGEKGDASMRRACAQAGGESYHAVVEQLMHNRVAELR